MFGSITSNPDQEDFQPNSPYIRGIMGTRYGHSQDLDDDIMHFPPPTPTYSPPSPSYPPARVYYIDVKSERIETPNRSSDSNNDYPPQAKRKSRPSNSSETTEIIDLDQSGDSSTASQGYLVDVEKLLFCESCRIFPSSPIFRCGNTHIFCGQCVKKFEACGNCGLKELSPSLMSEKLANLAKKKISCIHFNLGCTEDVLSTKFPEHLEVCYFRDVVCNQTRGGLCNEIVPFKNYGTHLHQKHNAQIRRLSKFAVIYSQKGESENLSYWSQAVAKYENEEFIVHAAIDKSNFYSWVSILGGKDLADKYICEIAVNDLDMTSKFERIWKLPIFPFHSGPETQKQLLQNCRIMCTPIAEAEKFWGVQAKAENAQKFSIYVKYKLQNISASDSITNGRFKPFFMEKEQISN